MEWHEFPIEIAGDPGAPRVRVLGPVLGGEMAASAAEPVVVAPEVATLIGKLERRKATPEQVFGLGRLLGDALLPGRVRELFGATRRALGDDWLRIRLVIEPDDLAALPWEYAHVARTSGDPQAADFLALASGVSLVRHQVTGAPLAALPDKAAFRVVLAIAEPEDLAALVLDRDREAVEDALELVGGGSGAIRLDTVRPATRAALTPALREADVFHFAGHGGFGAAGFTDDGRPLTGGFLVLENDAGTSDRLPSGDLALMLDGAGARLVVLGACESATRDDNGPWTGVASALTRNDVPAVVAMQYKVLDANASRFMAPFYAAIFAGRSIDEAVWEGRRAIFLAGSGVTERDWGVPALYSRTTDGVLFDVPDAPAERSAAVRVRQRVDTVRGTMTGVRGALLAPGAPDIDVAQHIVRVEAGATVIGVDLGEHGGC